MAYETKEKDTSLFAPRERRNENAADFEGRVLINGELHWVNMWRNKTRNGDEYFRIKLKPAQARADQISREAGFGDKPRPEPSYGQASSGEWNGKPIDDDEIPF